MIAVERRRGTVATLHALDPFVFGAVEPVVWWCDPIDDALVLGSRQHDDLVDAAACERAGLEVVRRRSGGGAVIMRRRSVWWIDIVLPSGFAPDDVRGSMEWIGECWRDVLADRSPTPLRVHRGGLESTAWSDLVCFAGVGPGEVIAADGKVVGLSQRRTRRGIRVQGLVYGESVAHEYRSVLAPPLPEGSPPGQAWLAGLDGASLAAQLAERITPV